MFQDGCTPLHLASLSGNGSMVQFLIDHGVDVNDSNKVGVLVLNS